MCIRDSRYPLQASLQSRLQPQCRLRHPCKLPPHLSLIHIFSFHVCLFFYLSGCLENFNHKTILENIQKKVINILIPFFFFAILGILYNAVLRNTNVYIHENLMLLLKGDIRNHINFGGGLWFLSCLFVIEILFSFIKKMNKKIIIFITCLILFMFSQFLISPPRCV